MYHLIKKAAKSFGDKVKIVEIEATLENVRRYGTADPLINGKIKLFGPASEEDVKKSNTRRDRLIQTLARTNWKHVWKF